MKKLIMTMLLLSTPTLAQVWELPTNTTYRVKATGFDCGEFIRRYKVEYTGTPKIIADAGISFDLLTADKDLNVFGIETSWTSQTGEQCLFGLFFNRARETRTLDLDFTKEKNSGDGSSCLAGQNLLKEKLVSSAYEGSKRGIRYLAVDLLNEKNDVCESGKVRLIFDRRAE